MIPESQLETWSHQGAIQSSSDTYQSIKQTLEAAGTPYSDKKYKVFLQGSYGNDTNIYAESDVDIVIQLDSCFQHDLSELSETEKTIWKQVFSDAVYTHVDFRRDVLKVLIDKYGTSVKDGNKAIMLDANGNRRKADVIPAIQFRRYHKFNSINDQAYDEGIAFFNSSNEMIVNYPKYHSANLTQKHQQSNQWLKPMVRILKNLRSHLVDNGLLKPGIAPSYYLEGLLYNVPNIKFGSSYQDCFVNAFNWIQQEGVKDDFVCANEQFYLLRDNKHTCWAKVDCDAFLNAAINRWNNWK